MKSVSAATFAAALSDETAALVAAIVDQADQRGEALYAVGGPVRDLLLGQAIRDVDLVLEAGDAAAIVAAAAPEGARIVQHSRFGTWSVRASGTRVDLGTARKESYAHPAALPGVEPGTLEEDLRRRDFSVNTLALPLSAKARDQHTRIVDVENGLADLERRRLRVLHPRSFHDDPTRALRAARLAVRLELPLTRRSRTALRDALRDGAFGRLSGERLRREFVRLIGDAREGLDPSRALRMLADWHVLGAIEPGLTLQREAVAPLRRLGRAIETPPWGPARWRPWVSALTVWLAPLAPALRRRALQRLAVRGDLARQIRDFPKARQGWLAALEKARGRGAIDAALSVIADDDLHALHAFADPAARRRIARYANEDRARRLPVTGDDLVAAGLDGPAVGRALRRIRTAYLDGTLRTREEALALADEIARRRKRRS